MRYVLSLMVAGGLGLVLIGCGPTAVESDTQTADNSTSGPQANSAGPPNGGQSSGQGNDFNDSPVGAGAGGARPGGDDGYGGGGFDPSGQGGGDRNSGPGEDDGYGSGFDPSGQSDYNDSPVGAGAGGARPGAGEADGYGSGFDPSGQGGGQGQGGPGEDDGYGEGFDPSGQGGRDAGGAGDSPPGGGAPPPPGQGGRNAGGSGDSPPGGGAPPPPGQGGRNQGQGNGGGTGAPGGSFSGNDPSFGGNQRNTQSDPQTLKELAIHAFNEGEEDDAFQYMYAYYLADAQGNRDHRLMLMPSGEVPKTAVRWGVAVMYSIPNTFNGAPPRIGDQAVVQGRQNNGGFGDQGGAPDFGGGGFNGGGSSANGPTGELAYYTGEYGELLLDRLEQRRFHQGGYYGKFLTEVQSSGDSGGNDQGRFGGGQGGFGGAAGGAALDDSGGPGGFGGQPQGGRNDDDDEEKTVGQLLPGVMYLGSYDGLNNSRAILEQAKSHSIDALVIFEVKVRVAPRTGTETTEATIELLDANTGDKVYQQRTALTNHSVWRDRQELENEDDDPIQLALDKVFQDNADEQFKLVSLPNLSGADAQARVDVLTASEPENPLPILAEIKYYHTMGLIADDAVQAAFQSLIGNAGEKLAFGSDEEKLAAIDKWMPGNFERQDNNNNGNGGRFR